MAAKPSANPFRNISESVLQKNVLEHLQWRGLYVLRINSGQVTIPYVVGGVKKVRVIKLAPAGTADTLVILPGGTAFWIECKKEMEEPRPDQWAFIEARRAEGCIAIWVKPSNYQDEIDAVLRRHGVPMPE